MHISQCVASADKVTSMAFQGKQFLFFSSILLVLIINGAYCQLDDSSNCARTCAEENFPPKHHLAESCSRGCRFYTISKLTTPARAPLEVIWQKCSKDCNEAYGVNEVNTPACVAGCELQQVQSKLAQSDEESASAKGDESVAVGINFAQPLFQVRRVVAQVIGNFHILKTSVLTYFVKDDQTLVAVESKPQIIVGVAPDEGFRSPEEAVEESVKTELDELSYGKRDAYLSERERESVSVVSLKARQTAYLLHLLMLLSVVALTLLGLSYCIALIRGQKTLCSRCRNHGLYILKAGHSGKCKFAQCMCLPCTTNTTRRRASGNAHVNIGIALRHEPLKLVRPEDLTKLSLMEDEAGPLPNKQDLALTHAVV